jgi:hypothetical protein
MSTHICILLLFLISIVYCDWITIDDNSVRTWNEFNGNRSKILTKFQITNYPKKYTRSLFNRIDTYTYDENNENIYFIMDQSLYGISKYFKYNLKTNQIFQTEQIQSFMIDHIQFNSNNNKLYSIIHYSIQRQFILVEIDTDTLVIKQQITQLDHLGIPMPGSYFNSKTELFTYHAYNPQEDHTVLITLDLSDNATHRFIQSKIFDFNVYAFGYDQSKENLLALWQYSIITPMVIIQIDPITAKQIQNITITPNGQRIAEGYKTFAMDYQKRLFYVLSWADDLSMTFISKINIDTIKVKITKLEGQIVKDFILVKIK